MSKATKQQTRCKTKQIPNPNPRKDRQRQRQKTTNKKTVPFVVGVPAAKVSPATRVPSQVGLLLHRGLGHAHEEVAARARVEPYRPRVLPPHHLLLAEKRQPTVCLFGCVCVVSCCARVCCVCARAREVNNNTLYLNCMRNDGGW